MGVLNIKETKKTKGGPITGCIFLLQVDGPITGGLISGSLRYFHCKNEMVAFNRFPHRVTDLKKSIILAILLFQFQSFRKKFRLLSTHFPV